MKKSYKTEILLPAPELSESDICRERIFDLIDLAVKYKEKANNDKLKETIRDNAIHELRFIVKRLLWELGV